MIFKKTTLLGVMAVLCLYFGAHGQAIYILNGRILDHNEKPLPSVTLKIGTQTVGLSNNEGQFTVRTALEKGILFFTAIGYKPTQIPFNGSNTNLKVVLYEEAASLQEVNVVNTGYQTLPKERATGSFVLIDSTLLNRSVSTNILERLDGVTSGLIFNKNLGGGFNNSAISIRGRSTIMGDPNPLIVVDNFPYSGDISSINPNDVESITILKDAAAASIWGTKAGNGVVVIKTKGGNSNTKATINFTSNITFGQKAKLFSQQQLSSREFIEVEKYLFEMGKYDAVINNGYGALSPAIEILLLNRLGKIDATQKNLMLDSLAKLDIREQSLKYMYRHPVNQQYQLSVTGGNQVQKYYISGGHDKNLSGGIPDSYERFTLTGNNTYTLLNRRIQINSGIQFINNINKAGIIGRYDLYPYNQISDIDGNHLAINDGTLRLGYVEAQEAKGLVDWHYRPLDELDEKTTSTTSNIRVNNIISFKISNALSVSGYHQFQKGFGSNETSYDGDSHYTRNLINSLSIINSGNGSITRPVPIGNILSSTKTVSTSNYGRLQLAYNKLISSKHSINGIFGSELSEYRTELSASTLYGYNPATGTNSNQTMDFNKDNPIIYSGGTSKISTGLRNSGIVDRYLSNYANLSYSYNSRYTVSASGRKDESNLFGVKSNQKGVPLWSLGIAWDLSNEPFYSLAFLPFLKLRATYGHSGNVDKSTSAYLTARSESAPNRFGGAQALITNPPNPSLSWEKVRNINLAFDFATTGNRIKGSIELYHKSGYDLIGKSPIAPQTGIDEYKGNSANLVTKGLDLSIETRNLEGIFQWQTNLLLNIVNDKVTNFMAAPGSNLDVVSGNYNNPIVGYPYNSIFSFKWAGLDNTGSPQAYLDQKISTDYTAIRNSSSRNNIVYHGSMSPTLFGSMLNTLAWKRLHLSFNIIYKTGYFLRRNSLNNSTLYNGNYAMPDYGNRWQKAGDELHTNVPSLLYPANINRYSIYNNADILVFSGSHIRLQDIRLNIDMVRNRSASFPIKQLSVYTYVRNPGLLWKDNDYGIDPDSPLIRQTTDFSFGIKAQF